MYQNTERSIQGTRLQVSQNEANPARWAKAGPCKAPSKSVTQTHLAKPLLLRGFQTQCYKRYLNIINVQYTQLGILLLKQQQGNKLCTSQQTSKLYHLHHVYTHKVTEANSQDREQNPLQNTFCILQWMPRYLGDWHLIEIYRALVLTNAVLETLQHRSV